MIEPARHEFFFDYFFRDWPQEYTVKSDLPLPPERNRETCSERRGTPNEDDHPTVKSLKTNKCIGKSNSLTAANAPDCWLRSLTMVALLESGILGVTLSHERTYFSNRQNKQHLYGVLSGESLYERKREYFPNRVRRNSAEIYRLTSRRMKDNKQYRSSEKSPNGCTQHYRIDTEESQRKSVFRRRCFCK